MVGVLDTAIDQGMYQAALKLLFPLSEKKTYQTIITEAIKLVGGKHASIFLLHQGRMQRAASSSREFFQVVPRKNGITMWVYRNNKPYLRSVDDIVKGVHGFECLYKKLGVKYDINIPLTYKEKVFGVLSVLSSTDTVFSQKEVDLLELFSPLATLAIKEAHVREKLKESLKARELFVSLAAHELKTPLTSISLYAQMLSRNNLHHKPDRLLRQNLLTEIARLTRLTNELLQINKIQLGDLEFHMKKRSLHTVIQNSIDAFTAARPTANIQLHNEIFTQNDMVRVDENRLIQVMSNLLTNAVKYSDKGSLVEIYLKKDTESMVIEVKDYGIGVSAEDLPHIFDKFYKGKSKHQEGLGLGLFLVKYIIQRHNGTLQVKSIVGEGTTVSIGLPFS